MDDGSVMANPDGEAGLTPAGVASDGEAAAATTRDIALRFLAILAVFAACALPQFWSELLTPRWWLATALLGMTLALLSAIDLKTLRLPDALTLPLIAAGLMLAASAGQGEFLNRLLGAAGGYLLLAGVSYGYLLVRKRPGLGLGDAKLMAASGAWIGLEGLPTALLVACAAALTAVVVAHMSGRPVGLQDRIPFGPFLAFATWVVWIAAAPGF